MYNCINIDSPIITHIENEENKTRKTVKQRFYLSLFTVIACRYFHAPSKRKKQVTVRRHCFLKTCLRTVRRQIEKKRKGASGWVTLSDQLTQSQTIARKCIIETSGSLSGGVWPNILATWLTATSSRLRTAVA